MLFLDMSFDSCNPTISFRFCYSYSFTIIWIVLYVLYELIEFIDFCNSKNYLDFQITFLVKNFTIMKREVDVEHNKLINIYCVLIEGCSWNF